MKQNCELANYIESSVKTIFLQGIMPVYILRRNGVHFNSSNDFNTNKKVSVNEITKLEDIKESLYVGGYGALSVVTEPMIQ